MALLEDEVMAQVNNWAPYLAHLAGGELEWERGSVPSGYYRRKTSLHGRTIWEGFAIWRLEDGTLTMARTGPWPVPTSPEGIEEFFGTAGYRTPITSAVYKAVMAGQPWPDEVVLPAEEEGDADLTPLQKVSKQIAALRKQATEWYQTIRGEDGKGEIKVEADAHKAANYSTEFGKLEKLADETRKAEKEPHLTASRQVDAGWNPQIELASVAKTWMKKANEGWLQAEQKRLNEEHAAKVVEANRIRLENEKAAAEAEKNGAPPPVIEAAPVVPKEAPKAKAGTGGRAVSMRTRDVGEITDRKALAIWFAENNAAPQDVFDAMLAFAMKSAAVGVVVPGIKVSKAAGAV